MRYEIRKGPLFVKRDRLRDILAKAKESEDGAKRAMKTLGEQLEGLKAKLAKLKEGEENPALVTQITATETELMKLEEQEKIDAVTRSETCERTKAELARASSEIERTSGDCRMNGCGNHRRADRETHSDRKRRRGKRLFGRCHAGLRTNLPKETIGTLRGESELMVFVR